LEDEVVVDEDGDAVQAQSWDASDILFWTEHAPAHHFDCDNWFPRDVEDDLVSENLCNEGFHLWRSRNSVHHKMEWERVQVGVLARLFKLHPFDHRQLGKSNLFHSICHDVLDHSTNMVVLEVFVEWTADRVVELETFFTQSLTS